MRGRCCKPKGAAVRAMGEPHGRALYLFAVKQAFRSCMAGGSFEQRQPSCPARADRDHGIEEAWRCGRRVT